MEPQQFTEVYKLWEKMLSDLDTLYREMKAAVLPSNTAVSTDIKIALTEEFYQ